MRVLILVALLSACGGRQAPLLFGRVPAPSLGKVQDIRVDLHAIDTDQFRIGLGNQTLIPRQLVRSSVGTASVVRGTFLGGGSLILARVGTTMTGVIRLGGRGYEIKPIPGGHRLIPWNTSRPPHDPGAAAHRGPRPQPLLAVGPVEITVLFAYTETVLKERTYDGIIGHIAVAMTQLENASAAGNVTARFVATETPFKTTGDEGVRPIGQIYDDLCKRNDFADAHAARKEAHADILVLLIHKVEGGLGQATIMADAESAVAVVDHNDSLLALTVPHEIGHVMGGIHEDDDSNYPFARGHGFVGGGGRTIVTNPCSKQPCVLFEEWSSAQLHGDGEHDVASVLQETAPTVATFGENLGNPSNPCP